ncbi:MAG: NAD-dependent epimerase/dehydratase family protein [Methanomassiliicoccales archaeon]|nr:NAD-dependent epimerase/dehydratase family protein [Methanomassiliicoccales archaeon]
MVSRIMVVGATGQIGSELILELRKRYGNDRVIAVGHSRAPSKEVVESGTYEQANIMDANSIERLCERYEIGTIYHLAAVLSGVGEKDPQFAWNLNMNGLINVLEIARKRDIKVFWPSSIAVFGNNCPRVNTPQHTALQPTTMYGVSKVAGELLCDYYHRKYDVDVRSVRYPGIISAEMLHGGGTTDYAVAIFYEAVRKNHYTCFVNEGTALPMMYMPDCINAAISIMEAPADRISTRLGYNLNGISFSAGELAKIVAERSPGFRIDYEPDFRQAIADSWPDSMDDSLATKDWGWKVEWGLDRMADDMFTRLRKRKAEGKL